VKAVVLDASVALRWLLDEAEAVTAFELLEKYILHAPDFLLVEVSNVLWVKTRAQRLNREGAEELYARLTELPITYWPTAELIARSRAASFAYDLTLYDTLYVALSARSGHPLATADQGIVAALQRAGKPELVFPL